jgi:hypothetical protein
MSNPIPPYKITTPYGKKGSWAAGYHTGDDYSTKGKTGIPVKAARGGTVSSTGNAWGSSYGIHVVIRHPKAPGGPVRVGYCHLSRVKVKAGQKVKKGQILGYSALRLLEPPQARLQQELIMANPFQGNVLRNEPVLIVGLVEVVLGMFLAFGVDLTNEQVGSIMALTSIVLAILVRMFVTPVAPVPPTHPTGDPL